VNWKRCFVSFSFAVNTAKTTFDLRHLGYKEIDHNLLSSKSGNYLLYAGMKKKLGGLGRNMGGRGKGWTGKFSAQPFIFCCRKLLKKTDVRWQMGL
jgi:hypothetical protein